MLVAVFLAGSVSTEPWQATGQDQPKLELVMKLVVTCTSPEQGGWLLCRQQ
jgi:hypothetical protein